MYLGEFGCQSLGPKYRSSKVFMNETTFLSTMPIGGLQNSEKNLEHLSACCLKVFSKCKKILNNWIKVGRDRGFGPSGWISRLNVTITNVSKVFVFSVDSVPCFISMC